MMVVSCGCLLLWGLGFSAALSPASETRRVLYHKVEDGDTIFSIAQLYALNVSDVKRFNLMEHANDHASLDTNQALKINSISLQASNSSKAAAKKCCGWADCGQIKITQNWANVYFCESDNDDCACVFCSPEFVTRTCKCSISSYNPFNGLISSGKDKVQQKYKQSEAETLEKKEAMLEKTDAAKGGVSNHSINVQASAGRFADKASEIGKVVDKIEDMARDIGSGKNKQPDMSELQPQQLVLLQKNQMPSGAIDFRQTVQNTPPKVPSYMRGDQPDCVYPVKIRSEPILD